MAASNGHSGVGVGGGGGLDLFRIPCAICGRKFASESLEKHQNICEKTSAKKRKTFNSAKQRLDGADGPYSQLTVAPSSSQSGPPPPPPPRKNKVTTKKKKQSPSSNNERSFLEPLKLNQGGTPVPSPITRGRLNGGGDYIRCPTCDRNFSDKAADRHIQWCREQNCRIPRSPPCHEAKDRLNARIQYRAPLPGKRRSSPPPPTSHPRLMPSNSNKSWSPTSQTSLNNLYLPSIPFHQSSGVKVTGTAITAQRRESDTKKVPAAAAKTQVGSSANGIIPSESWEWVTSNNRAAVNKPQKTSSPNANVTKKNCPQSVLKDDGYDPYVSAQKQLEELLSSTCGSPTAEQSPIIGQNRNEMNDLLNKNLNRSNRSSNWSLNSDKEAEVEELVEDLIIGMEPNLEDDFAAQILNMNDGRPSRLARRTVSREEALFGTKNSSGSQDSDYGSLLMRRSPSSPARLSPSHRFGGHNNFELTNLCISTSSSEASLPPLGRGDSKCSRFCHECGTKYPVMEAKFCCECGVKRFYAT